jgi:hypothetical protein
MSSLYWLSCVTGFLTSTCVADGDLSRAEDLLTTLPGADGATQTLGDRLCQAARAELVLARSQPETALQILDRLIAGGPPSAMGKAIPRLWYLRGKALIALGRAADAEAALRAAAQSAAAHGRRPILWRILVARSDLEHTQGRDEEAARTTAEVAALIQELAEAAPDDLRAGFRAQALQQAQFPSC